VCWFDSFVIVWPIGVGGGLLHILMEMGMVSVDPIDFVVRGDMKLWIGFGLF